MRVFNIYFLRSKFSRLYIFLKARVGERFALLQYESYRSSLLSCFLIWSCSLSVTLYGHVARCLL